MKTIPLKDVILPEWLRINFRTGKNFFNGFIKALKMFRISFVLA